MKYNFSFQKVLDVKEKEQEHAKHEYGSIKLRQIELQEQMEGLELEKKEIFSQYNHVDRKTISEIIEMQQDIEHVNRQMKVLEQQSKQVHYEMELKHQILIEKSKEAKMWNQWKEKSKEAFIKQVNQKEQAFLDELAVLRYTRRG
ncbi:MULTISPECIES: flagellar export protein FliJ [Bacillaceae]|uniref:flagellar export protein FliJ n=1 Tax=Bacillaceae TaxID=186817 RepID=UPI002FFF88F2